MEMTNDRIVTALSNELAVWGSATSMQQLQLMFERRIDLETIGVPKEKRQVLEYGRTATFVAVFQLVMLHELCDGMRDVLTTARLASDS